MAFRSRRVGAPLTRGRKAKALVLWVLTLVVVARLCCTVAVDSSVKSAGILKPKSRPRARKLN